MSQAEGLPGTLDGYLDWAMPASDALLRRLEQQAQADGIPIIGRREAAFIHLLTRVAQPDLILELGTATGYSGIWLLRAWPKARLMTFELDPNRAAEARRNFDEAGLAERVELRVENAVEGLESLPSGAAGLVFNDLLNGLRDESRVERCFNGALKVLKRGGLLLADNALEAADVLGRETREGRCVHRWNALVVAEPSLSGMIVPIEAGLSVAVRA
jgi:predicted O-methyltransferase YrrM